jgi:hypothetical protein
MSHWQRKPEWELRHWSRYRSVSEWFADYRGYVPARMAAGLSQLLGDNPGMTFPEAYALMLRAGATRVSQPDDCRRSPKLPRRDQRNSPAGDARVGRMSLLA